jgi:predicted metal-dependent enzyme (double-stranded beta helix superfamily)
MLPDSRCQSSSPLSDAAVDRLLADLRAMDARAALGRVRPEDVDPNADRYATADRYARFELVSPEEALIVLIVWLPGQFSPAHDHGGSACTFRVLRGIATEQRFERTTDRRVRAVEEDRFLPGSIVSCDGEDIHAMGNDASSAGPLVTLHVYRPRPEMNEYVIEPGGAL